MDRHYTPADLAEMLVSFVGDRPKGPIADFTVGEGALLIAARQKWPRNRILASDIDANVVAELETKLSNVRVACCDFLSYEERNASGLMHIVGGGVALALLNPPFSCRGGQRLLTSYKTQAVSCSRAMAFVLTAAQLVRRDGELLAILPSSCLTSKKDEEALGLLARDYTIEKLGVDGPHRFERCTVHISLVRLRRKRKDKAVIPFAPARSRLPATVLTGVTISRGTRSVHVSKAANFRGRYEFVHTTDLRDGQVSEPTRWSDGRHFIGPAVLIPRVGAAGSDKVCFLDRPDGVVLSDCIIALKAATAAETRILHTMLKSCWPTIHRSYSGSCAPYLTLERLIGALREVGVQADISSRSGNLLRGSFGTATVA